MVSLYLFDQVIWFHKNVLYCDLHIGCILLEFTEYKLLACFSQDEIQQPEIQVDLTTLDLLLYILCANIFQPLTYLKTAGPIYNMQNWLANNVKDIYNDVELEIDIAFDDEV